MAALQIVLVSIKKIVIMPPPLVYAVARCLIPVNVYLTGSLLAVQHGKDPSPTNSAAKTILGRIVFFFIDGLHKAQHAHVYQPIGIPITKKRTFALAVHPHLKLKNSI